MFFSYMLVTCYLISCVDGLLRFIISQVGNFGDDLPICRIGHLKRFVTTDPRPIDVSFVPEEVGESPASSRHSCQI